MKNRVFVEHLDHKDNRDTRRILADLTKSFKEMEGVLAKGATKEEGDSENP